MEASKDVVLQKSFKLICIGCIDICFRAEKERESIVCRSENYLLLGNSMKRIVMRHTREVSAVQQCQEFGKLVDVGCEGVQPILLRQDGGDTLSSSRPDEQKSRCERESHLFSMSSLAIEVIKTSKEIRSMKFHPPFMRLCLRHFVCRTFLRNAHAPASS
jgi:hypothetical protein